MQTLLVVESEGRCVEWGRGGRVEDKQTRRFIPSQTAHFFFVVLHLICY